MSKSVNQILYSLLESHILEIVQKNRNAVQLILTQINLL